MSARFPDTVEGLLDAVADVTRGHAGHSFPVCYECPTPTTPTGRLYELRGRVVGRFCPWHSMVYAEIEADARDGL